MKSMKTLAFIISMATVSQLGFASLVQGTPSPSLSPIFGVLVNFDDAATSTALAVNRYVGVGVASISDANNPLGFYSGSQSSPNYVGTGGGVGWAMDTSILLSNATNRIGIGIAGPSSLTLTTRDATGAIGQSYSFRTADNEYWVIDSAISDIASLQIQSSFIAIDDLQFETNSNGVPEPSTLALFGCGLAALVLRYRRC